MFCATVHTAGRLGRAGYGRGAAAQSTAPQQWRDSDLSGGHVTVSQVTQFAPQ